MRGATVGERATTATDPRDGRAPATPNGLNTALNLGSPVDGSAEDPALRIDARPLPVKPFVVGLFVLAVLYTLRLASDLLIPIVLALLLDFLLSPLIRKLRRRGIPNGVAATLVGLLVFGVITASAITLSGPAGQWIERAPQSLAGVEKRVRAFMRPFAKLQETTERVTSAVSASPSGGPVQATVKMAEPSFVSRMTGELASFGGSLLTVVFLTFFLLASGDLFMSRVIESIPQFSDKKKAVRIARDIEENVSRYLVTVTLVNVAVGLVTWGTLAALGMPNAALWGAMAGVLNFIPYLGALLTLVVIGVAAMASFEQTSQAMLMPLAFFVINMIESNVLTPIILGRRFPLNSVALFVGLLFWWYLWGTAGALLAVPLMVTLQICCDHVEMLRPYGAFLRRETRRTDTPE